MADVAEVSPESFAPNSYSSDELPEGGLADDELEALRGKLKDERRDRIRSYASAKLMVEFKVKIPGTDMSVELRISKNGD